MKTFRIKFNGRLGNQMFQYAFARALQLKLANGGVRWCSILLACA